MSVSSTSGVAQHKQHRALPTCSKCKKEFDSRIPRGIVVKILLPWLPLKHYVCLRCDITKYKF